MEQLELLKEIPGYKAILKSVIKSQIQILLEQLSNHTGEESIILTASLSEGTLSHLGSTMGKGFLEGRDEIKSHFLAYCLRSQQRRSMPEPRTTFQEQGPQDDLESTAKRQKIADPFVVPNQELNRCTSADSFVIPNQDNHNATNTVTMPMLSPQHNFTQSPNSETTLETQAGRPFNITPDESRTDFAKVEPPQTDSNMSASDSNMSIKLEPVGEGELDLEITGVELGSVGPMLGSGSFGAGLGPGAGPGLGPVGSVAPSGAEGFHGDWGQGTSGGYPLADSGDSTLNQSGSQYKDTKHAGVPKRQSCDLAIQTASSEAESNSASRPPTNGIEQDTNNYSRPSSDRNEQVNMGANMDRTKKERTESEVHTHSDTALPDRSDSISPFSHTLIRKQLVGVSAQLVVNLERVEDRIDNGNEAETDISLNKTNLEQPSNTGLRNSDSPQLRTKRQKLSIEDKTCSVCGWVGRGRGDVQDHMVKHTGEKRFSCSKCHEKFKCRPGRIRHQRRCRVGENRKDQCSSKSRVDFTKKDKVKNVDNVKVLGYSKSTEGFTKKDKAKRVVNDKDETASESNADLMKKDKGKSVVNDSSQSVSSGSVDFAKFTKKDTVQTMFNEMDQSVPSANIGFSKKNTQTRTKNLKNGRQCHYCGKIWATVTQLKIHLPKHTGERNFKCSKCDLRYKYPKNLRMHELNLQL